MQKPDMVHDRPSYELPYDVPKFNNLVGCVLKVVGVSFDFKNSEIYFYKFRRVSN